MTMILFKFLAEAKRERILKIGKVMNEKYRFFLTHSVDTVHYTKMASEVVMLWDLFSSDNTTIVQFLAPLVCISLFTVFPRKQLFRIVFIQVHNYNDMAKICTANFISILTIEGRSHQEKNCQRNFRKKYQISTLFSDISGTT